MDRYVPLINEFNEPEQINKMSTYEKIKLIYKMLILIILTVLSILLIIFLLDFKNKATVTMRNIDTFSIETLTVINDQNDKITKLENHISNGLATFDNITNNINTVLISLNSTFNNPNTTNSLLNIINNMENISSEINIVEFQNEIKEITCILKKFINKNVDC